MERYYFRARKHIEVRLNFFLAARSKMLCISVFMFFKVSRQIFTLDRFGRQADEYITRGAMFIMFFMYLCLPMDLVS